MSELSEGMVLLEDAKRLHNQGVSTQLELIDFPEVRLTNIEGVKLDFYKNHTDCFGEEISFVCWFPSDVERLRDFFNKTSISRDCWADFYKDGTVRISGDYEEGCDYLDSKEFREILLDKFQKRISCKEACEVIEKYVQSLKMHLN